MAVIDYKAANMNTLKKHCKALNESGLLPEPIEIRVGQKKQDLADAFVGGIEQCNDIGKLDDVPEEVYTYYTTIVKPEEAPATEPPAEAPAATPATGRGSKKAAPAKKAAAKKAPAKKAAAKKKEAAAPRVTRASVFAGIVQDGKARTKKELVEVMNKTYDGSDKDTPFWINVYTGLLLALGKMEKAEDGTLIYAG